MSKGFFTNKKSKPADSDVLDIIGEAGSIWNSLCCYLMKELNLKGEYKFYGVNYGWALRFIKSGKSIAALYPSKGSFIIQIILNENQLEYALSEDLDSNIIQKIMETKMIHEGKWIYLNQNSKIEDIIKLINIRVKIK